MEWFIRINSWIFWNYHAIKKINVRQFLSSGWYMRFSNGLIVSPCPFLSLFKCQSLQFSFVINLFWVVKLNCGCGAIGSRPPFIFHREIISSSRNENWRVFHEPNRLGAMLWTLFRIGDIFRSIQLFSCNLVCANRVFPLGWKSELTRDNNRFFEKTRLRIVAVVIFRTFPDFSPNS